MREETGLIKVVGWAMGGMVARGVVLEHSHQTHQTDRGGQLADANERMVYQAPERDGGERSADVRSDLYSLGCIAGYLLTGARPSPPPTDAARAGTSGAPPRPVAGDSVRRESDGREDGLRATALPPHASNRLKHTFAWECADDDIPRTLIEIVERLMAVDPAERFKSAHAVCLALESGHDPDSAESESPEDDEPAEGNGIRCGGRRSERTRGGVRGAAAAG